jgi:putative serine protease PepD
MKTKISALILTLVMLFSMSSCVLFDLDTGSVTGGGAQGGGKDTNVTIDNVNNYEVTINGAGQNGNVLAASRALLSAVSVRAGYSGREGKGYQYGSGVIYKMSEDKSTAYIITNYHVIYNSSYANQNGGVSTDIDVFLYGQESYLYEEETPDYAIPVSYLGGSMMYDLAVLKVEGDPTMIASNACAASFADSNEVAVLDTAIAIGNPKTNGLSATVGSINVESEYITMLSADNRAYIQMRVMRTDAAVNSGNSGGGLFNDKGECIGIVNAKLGDSDSYGQGGASIDNIGYAIPSNIAKYIAENIIYYCDGNPGVNSVFRCLLGITVMAADIYSEYDTETGKVMKREVVGIESLTETSAVSDYLKAGDIINSITVDGVEYEVSRRYHVVDSMLNARPKSTVVFNITRDGETFDVTIVTTQDMVVNADSN